MLERAFDTDIYEGVFIPSVVSRKKQVIPLLMEDN
jgi:inorganic pyrophosphatase/exopolyphosphatase